MTVRFFPGSRKQKTSLIEGFLTQHHVAHELARPEELASKTFHLGTDPAVEVDGRLFVDPNVDALKKIFHVEDHLGVGNLDRAVRFEAFRRPRKDEPIAFPVLIDVAEVMAVLSEKILQARVEFLARACLVGVMGNDDSHWSSGRRCITPLAVTLAIVRVPR